MSCPSVASLLCPTWEIDFEKEHSFEPPIFPAVRELARAEHFDRPVFSRTSLDEAPRTVCATAEAIVTVIVKVSKEGGSRIYLPQNKK